MAQQQPKAPKQQDPYASRGKSLTSAVQRLRGWVGSDPTRAPELADALVQLTHHRLLGHAYAAAAADAQEAVRYAAQLLTANGPIGPYTSPADGARYLTAIVHVATIQGGVGLVDAAGRTMASLHETRRQFEDGALDVRLEPATEIWALLGDGRAALGGGDVVAANAAADVALKRWTASGLSADADYLYLQLDVERLVSDARWAGRQDQEALGYLLSAKAAYDAATGDRLREPARLAQAVLERLAEPAFGLHRQLADRLKGMLEIELGLSVRRSLVVVLQGLQKKLGDPARLAVAAALADLADDLVAARRRDEAGLAAAEAARSVEVPAAGSVEEAIARVREQESLRPLLRAPLERAPAAVRLDGGATEARSLDVDRRRLADAWLRAERPRAAESERERRTEALTQAEQQVAMRRAAEEAAATQEAAEREQAERAALLAAQRAAAAEEAEREERKRRREERLEAHRREVEEREAERAAAERQERERRDVERGAVDPAQAEKLELERLEAELADLERAERKRAEQERVERERAERERAERERAERERAERERAEQERAEQERAEQERAEQERAEQERAEQERAEQERAEQERAERERAERERAEREELVDAMRNWDELKARGDRRGARAANERVVELLRPRAEADLAQYGPQLLSALEELSRARLRGGDLFGSRAPAREARELARALGR